MKNELQNLKKNLTVQSLFLALSVLFGNVVGFAQAPGSSTPGKAVIHPQPAAKGTGAASEKPDPAVNALGTLSVAPRSLLAQRLHAATLPGEAEVRCGFSEPCAFGFARGFALGGNLLRTALTPLVQPLIQPGRWIYYDGFVGFQFLNRVDDTFDSNGSVGYRGFSFKDSDSRELDTAGITFRVTYAQEITGIYTQGLVLSGFMNQTKFSAKERLYEDGPEGADSRQSLKKFYDFSHSSPTVYLGLPADIEVINWKASHIDMPSHLRGYAHIEPFYIQNDLVLQDWLKREEKSFGLRTAYEMTYESKARDQANRVAFHGALGLELAGTNSKMDYLKHDEPFGSVRPVLDARPVLSPYWNVMASYQF
jgi:hypothetical protein